MSSSKDFPYSIACDVCGTIAKPNTVDNNPFCLGSPFPERWGWFYRPHNTDIDVCCTCKKLTKVMRDLRSIAPRSVAIFPTEEDQ